MTTPSYETARARLVALITGAVPTRKDRALGAGFAEAPEASSSVRPDSRRFTLLAIADAVRTPLTGGASRRKRVSTLELRVFYPPLPDRRVLDLVLRSDHKAIGDALLNTAAWDAANSGIISVEQQGGALIMPATVQEHDEGVDHVYRFDLEYWS